MEKKSKGQGSETKKKREKGEHETIGKRVVVCVELDLLVFLFHSFFFLKNGCELFFYKELCKRKKL